MYQTLPLCSTLILSNFIKKAEKKHHAGAPNDITHEGAFADFDVNALRAMYSKDTGKEPPAHVDRAWLVGYHLNAELPNGLTGDVVWSKNQIQKLTKIVSSTKNFGVISGGKNGNQPFWTNVAKQIGGAHTPRTVAQYWYKHGAHDMFNQKNKRNNNT